MSFFNHSKTALWLSLGTFATALFAATDIANVPVLGGTGASVKPNIMLLMDTSNSMSWTHMPDQLEVEEDKQKIGYKSGQCNSLYYNPNQTYKIPKGANNLSLPTPVFTAARSNYYINTDVVNLTNAFQAHDANTVRSVVISKADTPQAAYYYVYSGTATLSYNSPPCTDADTFAANTSGTVNTTGGTWARKLVSTAERDNFAIWYTYYRTRMSLAKSAIGSAFAPLNDSYRVGFLNGNPTITVSGGSIISNTDVQGNRYEKIADFDATQKTAWFSKMHGQNPAGSSPTREALARVGRHYAGKTDGINKGMPDDPVQHSCQPNFTILTTDGYWNTEAEKSGVSGGPTNIAGDAWVGMQDNTHVETGLTPYGVFDGVINTEGYTDNSTTTTSRSYDSCTRAVSGKFTRVVRKTTRQYEKTVTTAPVNDSTRIEKRTSQLQKRTWTTKLSTVQYKQESTTTKKTTQQSKWYNPATETTSPVASCSGLTGCITSPVGPPEVVTSCTNSTGSAPDFIRVTCETTTTNDPVKSCTEGSPGCTKIETGPTPVRGDNCPSGWGANWVANTCTVSNDVTTLVGTCSGTVYSPTGNQTCTVVNQTGWATVASCANSGGLYVGTPPTNTECRTVNFCAPTAANNYCAATTVTTLGGSCVASANTTCTLKNIAGPTTVAPTSCVNDPTPNAANGWVGTVCSQQDSATTVDAACLPQAATSLNGWVQTLCTGTVNVAGLKDKTTKKTTTTRTYVDGRVLPPSDNWSSFTSGPCMDPATAPSLPADVTVTNPPVFTPTTHKGGSTNSLADVAQYYYITDLRPSMSNNVRSSGTEWYSDKANWQHMTTFVVGLGVSGTVKYQEDYATATAGDFYRIRQGHAGWPRWPEDPKVVNYALDAKLYNDPRSIDDFWHTAVNGRGKYFSANNPDSVVSGIRGALAAIDATVGAGSSVAISDVSGFTETGLSFVSSYVSGAWSGDLIARSASGPTATPTEIWSFRTKLNAQTQEACDDRNIWVRDSASDGNKLAAFTWNTTNCSSKSISSNLSSALRTNFTVTGLSQYADMSASQISAATGSALVNYIRGQRQNEAFVAGDAKKFYRKRDAVLGDIVNSKPQYVGPPHRKYTDAGYAAFKTNKAARKPMVYVGGNDGMLHAIYAPGETASAADKLNAGKEAWAYIPTAVISHLPKLADVGYATKHRYFVDGTPVIGDVKKDDVWRTILVGGLNAGGVGYYALDITDPDAPKSLWELDSSSLDIGLSFGKPVIGKLKNGKWVVFITSGYNNGTGKGKLFVVDAVSGDTIHTINTDVGTATSPSGLAQISAWVDFPGINDTVLRVYGGDLLGNVWRFDVNDSIAPSGYEATLLGTAKDASATAQPITTAPEVGIWNKQPFVFVGTGKLLGESDLEDTQRQSVYAFVDKLGTTSLGSFRSVLKPHETTADLKIVCTATAAVCSAPNNKGWFVDLKTTKERVNLPLTLIGTTMIVVTNEPKAGSCTAGSTTRVYYAKGDSGETAAPGQQLSDQGVIDVTYTRIKVPAGEGDGGSSTRYQGVTTDITGTRATPVKPPTTPGPTGSGRISWRQLFSW